MTKENKALLYEAIMFVFPISIMFAGLLQSHTGTDFIILGCTLYLGVKLNNLTD